MPPANPARSTRIVRAWFLAEAIAAESPAHPPPHTRTSASNVVVIDPPPQFDGRAIPVGARIAVPLASQTRGKHTRIVSARGRRTTYLVPDLTSILDASPTMGEAASLPRGIHPHPGWGGGVSGE